MRVIVNRNHGGHVPPHECENGLPAPAYESPGRIEAVRAALASRGGYTFEEGRFVDERTVLALHEPAYVEFLRSTSAELARAPAGAPRFAIPSVFPYGRETPRYRGKAQAGLFCFDTYTPITPGTFDAALSSASAACHGADLLAQGVEHSLYVLARPPGHHAERGRCGGYSYLNNAALAADRLSRFGPVAILDLDVHHGNGAQHLFYDRRDILVVSLHGDPDYLFPHFSGFADETGTGEGLGFNRNFPLPPGTCERAYRPALETALETIGRFQPAFLLVSFGTDAHEADPIGGFKLQTAFFATMGVLVRQLALSTLIVQEGGYNLETIGECAAEFLEAFRNASPGTLSNAK
jgi:acetoin utilization deacetylase AcuC-like enzyme